MLTIKKKPDELLRDMKKNDSTHYDGNSAVNAVKLLQNSGAQQDLEIAAALGQKHTLSVAQQITGLELEFNKKDALYLGKLFHVSQIEKLAIDYNLRFLSTSYFKGNMDVEVLAKIKQFAKDVNEKSLEMGGKGAEVDITNKHNLQTKFFILAPESEFAMETVLMERIIVDRDPLLFYKVDDTHYAFLHKWGKDFTITRWIEGFKWKSLLNYKLHTAAIISPIMAILAMFILGPAFIFSMPILALAILIMAIFIVTNIIASNYYSDSERNIDSEMYFSPNKWNKPFNIKKK